MMDLEEFTLLVYSVGLVISFFALALIFVVTVVIRERVRAKVIALIVAILIIAVLFAQSVQ